MRKVPARRMGIEDCIARECTFWRREERGTDESRVGNARGGTFANTGKTADRTRNGSVERRKATRRRSPGVAEGLGEREALIEGRHVREQRRAATTRLGTVDRSFLWQSMAEEKE